MTISRELLERLACPKCHESVELADGGRGLSCGRCRLLYEIRDGIPVMIVEMAKRLDAGGSPAATEA